MDRKDKCGSTAIQNKPGIHYRKSCASSGACLIASSGYQQFCTGELNSVCITCCDTPLCNGPKLKKRPVLSAAPSPPWARPLLLSPLLLLPLSLLLVHSAPLFCT
ncbi:ly6/PLAUR domain-containing protein 1-like [Alosa alosa]|uniref:ly6/PLAUR domain-containing protein 1-like n=1 Tax=Alosa alosa TaxID=278164 RepID=UPI0020151931|nr:ly6/PLAUR domain-containing protein 1-like [Alosa alosa]